ncbi:MAG: aquaporin family protein, partial [Methylobacteriaceae bacterium]|nr:aquaporin family protein [Methylobacteriaceae bacterium]
MSSIFFGELMGTMVLVYLGDSVVANVILKKTKGEGTGWIVITTAWAFAVLLGIFASNACGSPGAHINPAVTLAMALMNNTPWEQVPVFVSAQFIGGFIGAILVYLHYMPHFKATEDGATKLGVFSTGPAIRDWTNWLGEIFGTFMLVFSIVGIGK